MKMLAAAPGTITVDPRHDPLWSALAEGTRGGLFVSPPWISAVCATYGFTPLARIAHDEMGDPLGGIAWVPVHDFRGKRLCSLPFSDWADPICADERTWSLLSDGLITSNVPFFLRCRTSEVPVGDPRLQRSGEVAWHAMRLDTSVDDVFARFSSSARRRIRHAEREGVRVEAHLGIEGVRTFQRLQLDLRKRKFRMLSQPVAFFEAVWAQFSRRESIVTLLATVDGEPIAGIVFLIWNNVMHSKFAASRPEYRAWGANDALYGAGVRWGVEHGLSVVDWGISDYDQPGLIGFKEKYSSERGRVVSLRSTARTAAEMETSRALRELTTLLTEQSVPDAITEAAGATLYRYFC